MKYIKDNKVYDTETAVHIGGYSDLCSMEFFCRSEDLYKTKDGTYFLIKEDGSFNQDRVKTSQENRLIETDISILTEKKAMEWSEQYLG